MVVHHRRDAIKPGRGGDGGGVMMEAVGAFGGGGRAKRRMFGAHARVCIASKQDVLCLVRARLYPSNLYSSIHQRALDSRKRIASQLP